MRKRACKIIIPQFLVISLLVSCVPSRKNYQIVDKGEFQVSVYSGGKKVLNPNQRLVQRMVIPNSLVDSAIIDWPNKLSLPFTCNLELDAMGSSMGLRVDFNVLRKEKLPSLGLVQGDLITAVGTTLANDINQLYVIFEALKKGETSSITIQRGGVDSKIFFLPESVLK